MLPDLDLSFEGNIYGITKASNVGVSLNEIFALGRNDNC